MNSPAKAPARVQMMAVSWRLWTPSLTFGVAEARKAFGRLTRLSAEHGDEGAGLLRPRSSAIVVIAEGRLPGTDCKEFAA